MNHRVKGGRRALLLALLLGLAAVAAVLLWGRGRDAEGLRASGTIEATEARLGFPSPGRIEVVEVREGETVALSLIHISEPT
ncbi:MAG: hypothetical protein QUU85_03975, partial [Candidatus Eisenbacteria bacterium]|nr:hypothetical protein [Candidatus Eisenbacteria bacterium]